LLKRLFRIIVPVYNWGAAVTLLGLALVPALIAIFGDPGQALYLAVCIYLSIVACYLILGLAPDEMDIRADQIALIEKELDAAPLLARLGDRLWAPKSFQSWWWASDRISIVQRPDGAFILKARRRDLKVVRDILARP
jgi:hypothetical protein